MDKLKKQFLEIWDLFIHFKLKELFLAPTANGLLQFCRFALVGVISTTVDWVILYALTKIGLHYLIGAVFGYVAGIIVNYICSRFFVFSGSSSRFSTVNEFIGYLLIGLVGLGLTELILYLFSSVIGIHYMASKVISTVVVLLWNYFARKLLLYK